MSDLTLDTPNYSADTIPSLRVTIVYIVAMSDLTLNTPSYSADTVTARDSRGLMLDTGVHNQCMTNVCVIFNCIQVLISNIPQTHLFILVLKIFL